MISISGLTAREQRKKHYRWLRRKIWQYKAIYLMIIPVFVYFAKYKKLTGLKAGIYKLDKSWDVEKLLTVLNDPTAAVSKDILITVIPGDWAKEIAAKVNAFRI